jgi:Tol biopolymer transport system component
LAETFTPALRYLPAPYLAWSPDGSSLVISDRDSPTEPFALFLLSIETGERRKLTFPPRELSGDSSPAFSLNGRTLAFGRNIDAGLGDLYLLPLSAGFRAAGEARRITFENRGIRSIVWVPGSSDIVFSDRKHLWRVDAPESMRGQAKLQGILSLGQDIQDAATSRRGERLAYTHVLVHSNIWRMPAPTLGAKPRTGNRESLKPIREGVPFVTSTRDDSAPQFSPDGKRIAFMSSRSGNLEIWACDSDGSNSTQLTSFRGPKVTTPRWSPDGQRIAFDSDAEGEYDIWVIGANGGKPQRMTTHPANDGNPSWSRDGRWIYFDSARTGNQQVWKIPATGGDAIQVTREGGFAPRESLDGRFLYYTKALINTSLWKIPVDGGEATKVLDGLINYTNLDIVREGIYFVPAPSAAASFSIQFLNLATSQITTVAKLDRPIDLGDSGGLAVSPDGRWMLYEQVEQAGSELMLVENFR